MLYQRNIKSYISKYKKVTFVTLKCIYDEAHSSQGANWNTLKTLSKNSNFE